MRIDGSEDQVMNGHFFGSLMMVAVLYCISFSVVARDYVDRDDVRIFIDEMVDEYQFSREKLESWFAQAKKKTSIIDTISRPAEKTLT